MGGMTSEGNREALEPLLALRQHQQEFGPPSKTGSRQAAAYPFTRLRSDLVWILNRDVPMDRVTPLEEDDVVGQFVGEIESTLRMDPKLLLETARQLAEAEFPPTVSSDVLLAAGLDPESVFGFSPIGPTRQRRRSASWPGRVLTAWDRRCAFCGFDGQLGSGSVGLEAAHIRWFNFDGPDEMDNGLALCALHHKLFDRGVLGLSEEYRIQVSDAYTARTDAGRVVYDLLDRPLRPRPGTEVPALAHISWHQSQVFKGEVAS
jgi:putative restriction endonuclease